ncbi:MAG: hypothetical protein PUE22_10645, partial [Roseburia porci]|nr:hypothetical protein [Roseburia porci]
IVNNGTAIVLFLTIRTRLIHILFLPSSVSIPVMKFGRTSDLFQASQPAAGSLFPTNITLTVAICYLFYSIYFSTLFLVLPVFPLFCK